MALLEIVKYGDPVLRKKALPVDVFDEGLKRLAADMLETMYANNGVGLAANQVGVLKRVVVIDTGSQEHPQPLKLINPQIIGVSKDKTTFEEGCLSFPGITEKIDRPSAVKAHAFDENGRELVIEAEGLAAIAIQHELDHINGVVFIDRMTPVRKMLHNKELRSLKKTYKKPK